MYADIRTRSFLASDNDMNLLVRGVRLTMRVAHAECAKGVFEPKTDSTDTKDFFYMGDADPDRVRTISLPPPFLFLPALTCPPRSRTRRSKNTSFVTTVRYSTP